MQLLLCKMSVGFTEKPSSGDIDMLVSHPAFTSETKDTNTVIALWCLSVALRLLFSIECIKNVLKQNFLFPFGYFAYRTWEFFVFRGMVYL